MPNSRVVVVVDPGHGGRDPGAVGIGGLQEKVVVMDISQQVAAILQQNGIQAVLTRTSDVEIDLEPRVRMARQMNATLFVSIHANAISMSRPDVNGLETYYYQSGLGLARTIHNSILQSTGMPDRGVRQARFYVLRQTSMPAVLVETGFVTGREDAARLANPAFRRQMAEAIARGIIQYIQQNN
uniref:N-acetylmuramoyl-L-alanine amidase family protein n=1 Tax=Desertifilum tharense IPPAS B-1220 TaxID=1781255 RepID=A0ACD5GSS4_9CYAN